MKRIAFVVCVTFLASCRTTSYTAITSPMKDECMMQCPRGGAEESFTRCARQCGAVVHEDQACEDTPLSSGQSCVEQQGTKFSLAKTLVLAIIGVVVLGSVAGAGAAGSSGY